MSQYFEIHPQNPQPRLLRRAVEILEQDGVIVYPTDSCYALGCRIDAKSAQERISRIRQTGPDHHFTLVCPDLSSIATFAKVGNVEYRMLKALTPGPFTFLLPATRELPRRLHHPKRRTIGIRVPEHTVVAGLLEMLGEPILSSTLILPGEALPMTEPDDIRARLEHQVDAVVDGGHCGVEPTTVVDMTAQPPEILRHGREAERVSAGR